MDFSTEIKSITKKADYNNSNEAQQLLNISESLFRSWLYRTIRGIRNRIADKGGYMGVVWRAYRWYD